jgi:hypothetical protein
MREIDCYFLQYGATSNFNCYYQRGRKGRMNQDWLRGAFGPLSVQGQTRKQLLQRLLPQSKICASCTVQDDFLLIHGRQHEYRVHLGSGQVQMGPDWQVLDADVRPFGADRIGLPPGNDFRQLPFADDLRLADILRTASRLVRS